MASNDFTLAPPDGPRCIDCGQPVQRRRRAESYRKFLVPQIVRQGALCALCQRRLPEDATDIHIDHIVPLARGGTSELENLQAVCAGCNMRKGTR